MIDSAPLLNFIGNRHVFSIEEEKPKLLNLFIRIGCATIVDKLLPRGDDIALVCLDLRQTCRRDFREFEGPYRRVAPCREDTVAFPDWR